MIIHNLGSINIDLVFRVPHIPSSGETILSQGMTRGLGGKGANTSIAIAQSGAIVSHYGGVGPDGAWAVDALQLKGVDCNGIQRRDMPSGQAIIQVDEHGENAITLFKGANWGFGTDVLDGLFDRANAGDWLVLQNETDHVARSAERAKTNGMRIAYAAAPFDAEETMKVLPFVDLLALNEIEAAQLKSHMGSDASDLSVDMVLMTKGAEGAVLYRKDHPPLFQPAQKVDDVKDTTGAGDTFFGFFLGRLAQNDTVEQCLSIASAAAAISVTQTGAADAIPSMTRVSAFLRNR